MIKPNKMHNTIFIKKHIIRRYIYIGSVSAIILLTSLLSYIYSQSLNKKLSLTIDQLSENTINEKKQSMRNTVEQTIYFIEYERSQVKREKALDKFSKEELESLSINRISNYIHNLRLNDNGYIWVNHIVNFNGGDKYAKRQIHPNLPHTEGEWLSTNTQDIKGNRPYEAELNGIKKNGELYFEYYFKKNNSEKIAHKISFAKLYKPYNWVVATGVYLDDVDQLVINETKKMQKVLQRQKIKILLFALLALIIAFAIIVIIEKQINNLITLYEDKIKIYTQNLETLSVTDSLTGLYNRVKLDDIFLYEVQQAQRYTNNFSIVMLDLDKFKEVNDLHGHLVGDIVLQEIAEILRESARSTDTIGRWGGEEFLIIYPETKLKDACVLAEKIRKKVESFTFTGVVHLTCSFGLSSFHNNDSKESLIKRADQALYISKEKGRNCVNYEI